MTKPIKVGIIGLGTIGGGTAKVLTANASTISARSVDISLAAICDKYVDQARAKAKSIGIDPAIVTDDVNQVINNPEIDIVVELIGGINPALQFITKALSKGKSVVTANKDLVSTQGALLLNAAKEANRDFYFEAAVGGGIPIIHALKESLRANNFRRIMGIVNGTTNYILSQMTETGRGFVEMLAEAQRLGYAEADPTNDIDGHDAARKMAILASIAFNSRVTEDMVFAEGIRHIDKYDISYARQLGYVVKLLGIAAQDGEDLDVRVHPVLVPARHPLSSVNDAFNAVFVDGDALGEAMFYGRGAGELPTASAVVGDIIMAAENLVNNMAGISGCSCYKHLNVKPMRQTYNKYYFRLMVDDRSLVLAQIAQAIGENQVSIDAVVQKRVVDSGLAELVVVTHKVMEENMQNALAALQKLDSVDHVASMIRVLEE